MTNDEPTDKALPESMGIFVGAKIIRASEMSKAACHNDILGRPFDGNDEDGYLVVYADGYRSWSPKSTFETAYRAITDDELDLVL